MRNLFKYIIALAAPFVLLGCYKDETSVGTKDITELEIKLPGIQNDLISLAKNDTLKVVPTIIQEGAEKAVTYEWEVNYEIVSTAKALDFLCTKLGSFNVRLKVTNADGSAFKTFTLNVNSPYEEGLMVLGSNASGETTLSFLRQYGENEQADPSTDHFINNCFALNNPGQKMGKGIADIVKRQKQLLISNSEEGKIYFLNDKTFEVEAVVSAPDLPGFKPLAMNVPDAGFRTAAILCENGKVYSLALLEHLVLENSRYPTNVIEKTDFGFNFNDCFSYFWDATSSTLYQASAYYYTNSQSTFAGEDLVTFFYDNKTVYVVTKDKTNPTAYTKTSMSHYLKDFSTGLPDVLQQVPLSVSGTPTLTPYSISLINHQLKKMVYASGNKIYHWFYTGTTMNDVPFITVDKGFVTSLGQSPDGKILYVGVYDAAAVGLKGSIYEYDMDLGKLIKKYEGVTDKPMKIFYKQKN